MRLRLAWMFAYKPFLLATLLPLLRLSLGFSGGFVACLSVWVLLSTYLWHYFHLDLVPEHFHRLRDNRNGELGSFAALVWLFIRPADRAQ